MGGPKNGFRFPLNPWQISCWLLQVYNISLTLISLYYNADTKPLLFLFPMFLLFQLLVIVFGFLATKSDPTIKAADEREAQELKYTFFCSECNHQVNESTKHCETCGRCVENFDHHCKMLNNCVGDKNYKLFIWLIVSLEVLEFILLPLLTIGLVLMMKETGIIFPVLFLICIAVNFFFLSFITYLIGFHMYLKSKNLTTFELIMINRTIKNKNTGENDGKCDKSTVRQSRIIPVHLLEIEPETHKMICPSN